MIYLTKIKDEKLLNEVLKDIKEIRRADTIIDTVQTLDMSRDNTKKILSATTDAKAFYADSKIKTIPILLVEEELMRKNQMEKIPMKGPLFISKNWKETSA